MGVPDEGFAIQQRRAIPDTIIVDGPADVLDDLLFVNTEAVDISGATESVSTVVALTGLPEGVTIVEPASGRVEVRVAIEDTSATTQTLSDLPVQVVGLEEGLTASVSTGIDLDPGERASGTLADNAAGRHQCVRGRSGSWSRHARGGARCYRSPGGDVDGQ